MRIFNAMMNSICGFYVEVIEVTRRMLSKDEKNYFFESALLNVNFHDFYTLKASLCATCIK